MTKSRELTEEELHALDLNSKAGISRSALESGDVNSETMEGKLEENWHAVGMKAYEERALAEKDMEDGFKITKKSLAALDEWVTLQVQSVTQRRNEIRERNMKLIKEFSKGGRFEGRTLDPRAFFKGDEMEEVATKPGGIADAMSMKSSLPTAIAYLSFLQEEGYDIFANIKYNKVIY